jgi:hypothetical protein
MPEKLFKSRIYGLMALLFGTSGIVSIAVLRYFPASSLYELLFLGLGVFLIVVAFVFVFFTLLCNGVGHTVNHSPVLWVNSIYRNVSFKQLRNNSAKKHYE